MSSHVRSEVLSVVFMNDCFPLNMYQKSKEVSDKPAVSARGELSYLAPLGSEDISAPYFKQCFFRGGDYPPDSQTPRLPVPRQK